MNLLLLFDHRFFRARNGVIFSDKGYDYGFIERRYLRVFEKVFIVSRVAGRPDAATPPGRGVEGTGAEVIALPDWNGPLGFLRHRDRIIATALDAVRRAPAVIMIVPGGIGSLLLRPLRRRGYPFALEVVGDPYDVFSPGASDHPLRFLFRWWLTRQLQRQCREAAAVAYVTERALQSRYPSRGLSVGVSDIELAEEGFRRAQRPRPPGSWRLITVVTLAQMYKRVDVLLDAVAACVGGGLDLTLGIVGDGKHRAELEELARRLGIAERVRFHGRIPPGAAIREQLDSADLFVLPSQQEGLSRAMVEAMARSLPCIGSKVGGMPELLEDEDMVPPGDTVALASKIREVLSDPERLDRMAARNYEQARRYRREELEKRRDGFLRYIRAAAEQWMGANGPETASMTPDGAGLQ